MVRNVNRHPRAAAPPTIEQKRHFIDSGQTGDKVAGNDPAAAPLGSDDEAAGHVSGPSGPEPQPTEHIEQRLSRPVSTDRPSRNRTRTAALVSVAVAILVAAAWIWSSA